MCLGVVHYNFGGGTKLNKKVRLPCIYLIKFAYKFPDKKCDRKSYFSERRQTFPS